jgi:hypothetical protein
MYRVEHRELTAQRTHGAIVLNVFHFKRPRFIKRPRFTIHSLFGLLRRSHYHYSTELFFDLFGSGPALDRVVEASCAWRGRLALSPPTQPGGFFLASPPVVPLQAINGDKEVGPPEHFNQSVKDALVIVRSRL